MKVDSDPACRCATTGARGPYAALVVDKGGMAGLAGSGASRAVLAFPLCSLDCRLAQGFWLWWPFQRCSSWTRLLCFCHVPWSRQCIPSGGAAVAALLQGR